MREQREFLREKNAADIAEADLSLFLLDSNYFTDHNSAAYINHVIGIRELTGCRKLRSGHFQTVFYFFFVEL